MQLLAHTRLLALLAVAACAFASMASGASSNLVVNVDIPSATTLVTTTCAPNTPGVTDFGVVLPGSTVKTSSDCDVTFGSSNDSASLRMTQSDGAGSAMSHPTDVWTRHTGSANRIFGLSASGGTVWAAGANGGAYRSLDNGLTWSVYKDVNAGSAANLGSVSQPTAAATWMAGSGELWRTTQSDQACAVGGATCWSQVNTLTGARGVAALSANVAWVAGAWVDNPTVDSHLHYTSNGGGTWTPVTPVIPAGALDAVRAFDANTVVAWKKSGTTDTAMATADGTTWRSLNLNMAARDIFAISDTVMLAVSYGGTIQRTANAMDPVPTWTTMNAATPFSLAEVECLDALNCVAVGERGVMVTSGDGGQTWAASDVDTSYNVAALEVIGGSTFIGGSTGDTILRSANTGADWTVIRSDQKMWWDVATTYEQRAWRVGNDGLISRSTDKGVTWTAQTPETGADLFGVHAWDINRAVAVGRGGTIMRTTNGGTTWTPVTSPTSQTLHSMDGVGGGSAWAVGDGGVILRTGDYGATWSVVASTPGNVLQDVVALRPNLAIATGRTLTTGVAFGMRTADGMTWSTFATPDAPYIPVAMASVRNSDIASMLVRGGLYRTTDGGATWTMQSAPGSENNTEAITMPTPTMVVGTAIGTIRRSTNGGQTWSGGGVSFHIGTAIDSFDRTTVISIGDGGTTGTTGSTGDVDNYVQNTSDWIGDGTEAFGACLRATTATPTWTPNGTCDQTADGAHWKAIPTLADSTSEVASTASGDGNRVASFRFGLRIAPSEPPGELAAGITFFVVAPDV